jgi:tRNA A37 methylthiotransferase MiaB
MGGAVAPDVVRARVAELRAASDRLWARFVAAQVGRTAEVVVERVADGVARGTARGYATVRWPASDEGRGDLVRVRVERSDGAECVGVRAGGARPALR